MSVGLSLINCLHQYQFIALPFSQLPFIRPLSFCFLANPIHFLDDVPYTKYHLSPMFPWRPLVSFPTSYFERECCCLLCLQLIGMIHMCAPYHEVVYTVSTMCWTFYVRLFTRADEFQNNLFQDTVCWRRTHLIYYVRIVTDKCAFGSITSRKGYLVM